MHLGALSVGHVPERVQNPLFHRLLFFAFSGVPVILKNDLLRFMFIIVVYILCSYLCYFTALIVQFLFAMTFNFQRVSLK